MAMTGTTAGPTSTYHTTSRTRFASSRGDLRHDNMDFTVVGVRQPHGLRSLNDRRGCGGVNL